MSTGGEGYFAIVEPAEQGGFGLPTLDARRGLAEERAAR